MLIRRHKYNGPNSCRIYLFIRTMTW